jgi:hypothetical protein
MDKPFTHLTRLWKFNASPAAFFKTQWLVTFTKYRTRMQLKKIKKKWVVLFYEDDNTYTFHTIFFLININTFLIKFIICSCGELYNNEVFIDNTTFKKYGSKWICKRRLVSCYIVNNSKPLLPLLESFRYTL